MNEVRNPESPHLEFLHGFFKSATHDASAAMCRWTNGLIALTLDEVREIPLESVCEEFDFGMDLTTMVVLSLEGDVGGEMILTFDERDGRQLASILTNEPAGTGDEWSELEKSALAETGNILGCAYMNALTRLIGVELVPSPPYFIQDYGASVIQQALAPQAMSSDQALICRTRFHREGTGLDWHVFFMPSTGLRKQMEDALGGDI